MTVDELSTFNPAIAEAVRWLVDVDPPRPRIPKLRERFALSAAEAIQALRIAEELRREART